jgi:DNA polymerase III sliding clamp (beta) subunit (PCNA family)
MLATMDGKTVEIHQADKTSPALFLDPSDETFTGVIMPIRI